MYGEGARDSMFIGKLLRGEIKYATNHIRDFIHVSDVVDGIMLFVKEGTKDRLPAYNMGTGKGNKVFEVAHAFGWLGKITDGDDCEALDNTADNSELLKLGWKPKVDVMKYVHFQKIGKPQFAETITDRNQFDATGPEAVLLAQPDNRRNPKDEHETLSAEEVGGWEGNLVKNNP